MGCASTFTWSVLLIGVALAVWALEPTVSWSCTGTEFSLRVEHQLVPRLRALPRQALSFLGLWPW